MRGGHVWICVWFPLLCLANSLERRRLSALGPGTSMRQGERKRRFISLRFSLGRDLVKPESPCTPRQPESSGAEPRSAASCPTRFGNISQPKARFYPSFRVSLLPSPVNSLYRTGDSGGAKKGECHRGKELAPKAQEVADKDQCAAPLLGARRWRDGVRRPRDRERWPSLVDLGSSEGSPLTIAPHLLGAPSRAFRAHSRRNPGEGGPRLLGK